MEVSKELLKDTLNEIAELEHAMAHEFGLCETVEELEKEGMMPECYYKLKKIIENG